MIRAVFNTALHLNSSESGWRRKIPLLLQVARKALSHPKNFRLQVTGSSGKGGKCQ